MTLDETRSPAGPCHVSIVIPTYRECENLRPLMAAISGAMANAEPSYEVIIIDDDSHDGSGRTVAELSAAGHPVRLITRVGEKDLGSAVVRGFSETHGEILICMDADLSHPPEAIPAFLERLRESGTELVLGSRYVSGASTDERWGALRRLNSSIAALLARPFTSVKDPMSGFFAIPRAVYERAAPLNPIGYKIALELIVKCNCSAIVEIPVHFAQRRFGASKLSCTERLKYLRHLTRLACYKLSHFVSSNQVRNEFKALVGLSKDDRSSHGYRRR
jgi:dolichol-phosphate mannosyltransferase